jgi:NADH/NAD ratio-sensing transcriptional regulator Rex
MKKDKVSSAVIRRLPRYYRHLNDLYLAGVERISSNALGKSMGLTASQIRQDLSCFGGFGQQGYGYNIENLRGEISDILGMNRGHNAVILGAGNLGRALMENFHFERSGVALSAAFDVAPDKTGTEFPRGAGPPRGPVGGVSGPASGQHRGADGSPERGQPDRRSAGGLRRERNLEFHQY